MPQLDTAAERALLERALQRATDSGAVTLEWLEHASLRGLNEALRSSEHHVLHFVGHGGFDQAAGEGVLVLEGSDGSAELVGADHLTTVVGSRDSLRLIVLNAAEGARASLAEPFSSVAGRLVRSGVPAAIAMQFEITDRAALVFAEALYAGLAAGEPVDRMVREARLAMFADIGGVEWATPVLTMQPGDGRLFEFVGATGAPHSDLTEPAPTLNVTARARAGDASQPMLYVRSEETVKRIADELRTAATGELTRPAVVVITGPHGSGKTTMAVRAAEAVGDAFPDGYFHVSAGPDGNPQEALAELVSGPLRPTVGDIDVRRAGLPDLQSMFRQALLGRRAIVIVDEISDGSGLEALAPPDARSALIATALQPFEAPGATFIPLEPLSPAEVEALLDRLGVPDGASLTKTLKDQLGEITLADIGRLLQQVATATGLSLDDILARAMAAGMGGLGGGALGEPSGGLDAKTQTPSEPLPSPFRRSGYSSDMVPSAGPVPDHLQMQAEVDALAWVVSARDATPPLSIGLFGAWGTGKSTFMRLMQTRIDEIAAEARASRANLEDHPACEHVRQITFNAWHYADSNLWASLVTHIFEELAELAPGEVSSEYRNLVDRLATTRSMRQDAQARKDLAGEERTRRLGQLDDVKRERTEKARNLERGVVDPSLVLGDQELHARARELQGTYGSRQPAAGLAAGSISAWLSSILGDPSMLRRAVEIIPIPSTRDALLAVLDRPDVKDALARIAKDSDALGELVDFIATGVPTGTFDDLVADPTTRAELTALGKGLREAYKDALEVGEIARTVRSAAGRTRYLVNLVIQSAKEQPRSVLAGGFATAIALGGIAWLVAANGPALLALGTSILGVVGVMTAAIRIVHEPTRKLAAAVDFAVDLVQSRARQQIDLLAAQEQALEREVEELTRAEHAAERELEDIRQGRRLYRYLEERAASTDYRPYLGIVAQVRKDFETLTSLMDEGRLARDDAFKARRLARASTGSLHDDAATTDVPASELPTIDRVILYIDDLDRCAADRVVQVLEAVHLLLALKLFVVVVGVDPRWLMRSLRHHYTAQLSPTGAPLSSWEGDVAYWESTPENYLEKIFQVPFSLRPMTRSGYEALIADVLRPSDGEGTTAIGDDSVRPSASTSGSSIASSLPTNEAAGVTTTSDRLTRAGDSPVGGHAGDGSHVAAPVGSIDLDQRASEATDGGRLHGAGTGVDGASSGGAADTAAPGTSQAKAADDAATSPTTPPEAPRRYAPPPRLTISAEELGFVQSLSPFVPTPRSAKRLANTYRLIRVLPAPLEANVDNDATAHQIPLTLLAIVIGYPALAGTVFRELLDASDPSWAAFKARVIESRAEEPKSRGDGPQGDPRGRSRGGAPKRTTAEKREIEAEQDRVEDDGRATPRDWRRLSDDLDRLPTTPDATIDLAAYRAWAQLVGRFSFESGRVTTVLTELSHT
jgi:tRNA A37 threonylcarbamoyladenosine biosynthesis protein TsaE